MKCPVCKKTMIILEYEDIELDYCPRCKGTWLDAGELELLLFGELRSSATIDPSTLVHGKRVCPRCKKRMRIGYFPGTRVEVDVCPVDRGIWLDQGELLEIAKSHAESATLREVSQFFRGVFGAQLEQKEK